MGGGLASRVARGARTASSMTSVRRVVSELHPETRGFAAADVYERGRPDYPAAAIEKVVDRLEPRPAPGPNRPAPPRGTGKAHASPRAKRRERNRGRAGPGDAHRARAAGARH